MEYRGPENKTIYILLPDGFTHRIRVWWKETPKSLNKKFIQRFGEKCYKLELWQTKVVNAETRQEADMLLNENSKAYNTRVGSLEKEKRPPLNEAPILSTVADYALKASNFDYCLSICDLMMEKPSRYRT